ncbi:MAG: hypothetical protein IJ215_03600 [Clostridia bacterium]|nr:hypothetical protein [Clostridia bacterium]
MRNSFYYIKKEELRESADEIAKDFMSCRDISYISQVMPLIEEFTNEGDTILEPFCGLGTTVIAAGMIGRKSIGIEIEESRFHLLKKHVDRYKDKLKEMPRLILGDCLNIEFDSKVDAIITNVPYFNPYDKNTNIKDSFYCMEEYNTYLQSMDNLFKKLRNTLNENGYIVVFCENIRDKNGNMIPQSFDICKIMQKYYHLKDERIICYEKDNDTLDGHLTNRAHEYVFIGQPKIEWNYDKINKMVEYAQYYTQNIDAILYGSLYLYVTMPEILVNPPKDIDLIIKNDLASIKKAIRILKANNFTVYSWNDEILDDFDFNLLKGRYYIRAKKDEYVIDIMYESNDLSFEKMKEKSRLISNIVVISNTDYVEILEKSKRHKDKETLFCIKKIRHNKKGLIL